MEQIKQRLVHVREVTYQLKEDDADQVQDLIEGAESVYYDVDDKVLIFKNLKSG